MFLLYVPTGRVMKLTGILTSSQSTSEHDCDSLCLHRARRKKTEAQSRNKGRRLKEAIQNTNSWTLRGKSSEIKGRETHTQKKTQRRTTTTIKKATSRK